MPAHVVGNDEFVEGAVGDACVDEDLRRDADHAPAGGAAGVGEGAHGADVVAAVDEGDAAKGKGFSDLLGRGEVDRRDLLAGGAVDGDGGDGHAMTISHVGL